MKQIKQMGIFLFLALSLLTMGCGGDDGGGDTTPPTVSSVSPANGATDVAINTVITATFSEAMNSSTINTSTFTLNSTSGAVTGTVTYSGTTATFTPSSNLSYSATYTATITTGVKDSAGNAMAANYTWSFTTISPPSAPTASASGGDGQVTVSWSAVTSATSYNIYWSTTSGVTTTTGTKISDITSTSYTHTGLTNGTTYYYIVTAVTSAGESSASNEVLAKPLAPSAQTAPIDTTNDVGQYASLALDPNTSYPKIAYYDNTSDDLKYAEWNPTTQLWETATIDSTGNVGQYAWLDLDSQGRPRIAYYDATGGDTKYASCDTGCTSSTNWTLQVAVAGTAAGQGISLKLTSAGEPMIAYHDHGAGDLKFVQGSGTTGSITWSTPITVDNSSTPHEGHQQIYLIVNSSGAPRIVYSLGSFSSSSGAKYAACNTGCTTSSNWSSSTVTTSTTDIGYGPAVALDESTIHYIYHDHGYTNLKYSTSADGATWTAGTDVDGASATDHPGHSRNSIFIDSGKPRVAYINNANSRPRYAKYDGTTWTVTEIDTSYTGSALDTSDQYISMAKGADGKARIAYYDSVNGDLKYWVEP